MSRLGTVEKKYTLPKPPSQNDFPWLLWKTRYCSSWHHPRPMNNKACVQCSPVSVFRIIFVYLSWLQPSKWLINSDCPNDGSTLMSKNSKQWADFMILTDLQYLFNTRFLPREHHLFRRVGGLLVTSVGVYCLLEDNLAPFRTLTWSSRSICLSRIVCSSQLLSFWVPFRQLLRSLKTHRCVFVLDHKRLAWY